MQIKGCNQEALTSSVISASSASISVVAPSIGSPPFILKGIPFLAFGLRILIFRARWRFLIAGGGFPCRKSSCHNVFVNNHLSKSYMILAHPVKTRIELRFIWIGCNICSICSNISSLRFCMFYSCFLIELDLLGFCERLLSLIHLADRLKLKRDCVRDGGSREGFSIQSCKLATSFGWLVRSRS